MDYEFREKVTVFLGMGWLTFIIAGVISGNWWGLLVFAPTHLLLVKGGLTTLE